MTKPTDDDRVRVLPAADMLKIILKNTFFEDGLLDEPGRIAFGWEETAGVPVLHFGFTNPGYDLALPLWKEALKKSEAGWLTRPEITIQLQLSETVITDRIARRNFTLNPHESEKLRAALLR
ncbi:hypothetical protein [Dyadobacter sandarakinus]|uniref:Uncharacterized protein n=1 Tax=Dyadobacter sandarakinus TaxID=2747268 RepID=A0ABX7I9G2_9BACT|nr:hypothetical protein [Dyadobacter sandarakinus]QRR02453.1 hypothetical protein HWI92_16805 [Dyadobacter sandarakinus]